MSESAVIPGVLLRIQEAGVLLTGPSGAGKSDTALSLLLEGSSALIADDAVRIHREGPRIIGRCPTGGEGLLSVRDLGIVDVRVLSGPGAVTSEAEIELIIDLDPAPGRVSEQSTLHGRHDHLALLGIDIPRVRLTGTTGRPIPDLVRTATRALTTETEQT